MYQWGPNPFAYVFVAQAVEHTWTDIILSQNTLDISFLIVFSCIYY